MLASQPRIQGGSAHGVDPVGAPPLPHPPRAGIGYTAKPRRTGSVSDTLIGNRLPGSANDLSSARRDAVVKAAHSPFLQPGRRGSSCGNRAGIPVSCGENRLAQCLSSCVTTREDAATRVSTGWGLGGGARIHRTRACCMHQPTKGDSGRRKGAFN